MFGMVRRTLTAPQLTSRTSQRGLGGTVGESAVRRVDTHHANMTLWMSWVRP
jgi:hypothetical protein